MVDFICLVNRFDFSSVKRLRPEKPDRKDTIFRRGVWKKDL